MKLTAIVVDDEPIARLRIRRMLDGESGLEVIAECADGEDAVAAIRRENPDLVFLDIQMLEMDGFEVVKKVGAERMPATIFVTAHDQFALRAFDAHALHYLLKPFGKARFGEALARAKQHIAGGLNAQALPRFVAMLSRTEPQNRHFHQLPVSQAGRIVFVATSDIDWIEAAGNYSRLHAAGREYDLRETLTSLCGKLDSLKFVRIHRSTIVNMRSIREIHPWFGGHHLVILNDGTQLRLSRYQTDAARQLGL